LSKRSLIGAAVVLVVLAAGYSVSELAGTVAQLRTSLARAARAPAAASGPQRALTGVAVGHPVVSPAAGAVDEQTEEPANGSGALSPPDSSALSPTDSRPASEPPGSESAQRPDFDPDAALRAAIELDPEIGELANDPDPAVRSAVAAFFTDEE
jgi:hypothetical protein